LLNSALAALAAELPLCVVHALHAGSWHVVRLALLLLPASSHASHVRCSLLAQLGSAKDGDSAADRAAAAAAALGGPPGKQPAAAAAKAAP
jgi:hypothetical protein